MVPPGPLEFTGLRAFSSGIFFSDNWFNDLKYGYPVRYMHLAGLADLILFFLVLLVMMMNC